MSKWISNSRAFLYSNDPNILLTPNDRKPQLQRVLGANWDSKKDCFFIDNKKLVKILHIGVATQRALLQYTASLFDPFSRVASMALRIRKVLQSVWSPGVKWDTPLGVNKLPVIKIWLDEIECFEIISLPRNFDQENHSSIQLNTFCDVSEFDLAAVFYLRIAYNGFNTLKFVIGKARLAPVKRITITNIELQTAM